MTVQLLDIVTQKQLNEEPCVLIDDKRPRLTEDPKTKTLRESAFPLVQPIRFDQLFLLVLTIALSMSCNPLSHCYCPQLALQIVRWSLSLSR